MAEKLVPNYRVEREGRSLSDWLQDLVSEDVSLRLAAGEALGGMYHGTSHYSEDFTLYDLDDFPDTAGQMGRFNEAVRDAVEAEGFPENNFILELCRYRIALKKAWQNQVKRYEAKDEKLKIIENKLIDQLSAAMDTEEKEMLSGKLERISIAGWNLCDKMVEVAECSKASGIMAKVVFDALDTAFLVEPRGLWEMLNHKELYQDVVGAISRIGPEAIEFADYFMSCLDSCRSIYDFGGASALGAICKGNPILVDQLLERLRNGTIPIRAAVAETLQCSGPDLAGRTQEAINLLLDATFNDDYKYQAVEALASVGRESEKALNRIIQLAEPRPPRWRKNKDFPEYEYDEVMGERGIAITALAYFQKFSDRVIPLLIDAVDTFEEYDPDYGEQGRVCDALTAFGPLAAPAVPRIIQYLEEWLESTEEYKELPPSGLKILENIGPPAKSSLPILYRIHNDYLEPGKLDPIEEVDRAIMAIQGEEESE